MHLRSLHTIKFLLLALSFNQIIHGAIANWNHVSYIQADNNLAPYAGFNVREMLKPDIPSSVNVLIEWDKPNDNKTWRYQIKNRQLIDAGTFTGAYDLGTNPVEELIDMVRWAKEVSLKKYNALKWCINLWNHGYGILDPRLQKLNQGNAEPTMDGRLPWLMVPGISYGPGRHRGILFDDSQGTYVTAAGLTRAVAGMRNIIGNKIDILSMDACLMAMIEVGYQVNGLVDTLVASENTEPGRGFNYAGFLGALAAKPTMSTEELATAMVRQYAKFYGGKDPSLTLSAIKIDALVPIKENIKRLITAINTCYAADRPNTLAAVRTARHNAMSFDIPDYLDMLSLYNKLKRTFASKKARKPKQGHARAGHFKPALSKAVNNVCAIINAGIPLIRAAVIANMTGRDFKGACGISIYFPMGPVDPSYPETQFAQDTGWDQFIDMYQ